ncbi:hypothetical protein EXIGLDRAFT_207785 [Exidia glandulosa HHB12029]|uniref:Glucose receptor Git3 N-terminal domain-containing protein n=1 Tax=Exidia glandulosa HHB12029 TaxID=1314781 RepID=A0A165EKX0_EXIGL|nr:hypothetical protein EXIGLDRAFT_207785 [Exidia glandulosa HHB12029]
MASTSNNIGAATDMMTQLLHVVRSATSNFNPSASLAIVIPSLFSAVAVLAILAHIATAAAAQYYRRMVMGEKGERIFATTPLGIYIISLLFSSLLSAIGASLNIEWVRVKGIETNTMCSAQATMLQAGSLGTAFFILYISAHALNAVILRKPVARWVLILSLVALWALVLFLDLAGPLFVPKDPLHPFYGPAGSWCWITRPYLKSQQSLQGIPMVIVSGASMIMFAIVFLKARGGDIRGIMGKDAKNAASNMHKEKGTMLVGKYLVWYPVVYILFSLPLAVVAFVGKASTIVNGVVFAEVLYSFQGLAFVAIFVCTYRVFGGRPWRFGIGSYTLQGSAAKASGESFEALEKAMSPVTPEQQWKPATKEWAVERTQSTRSRPYSMVSAVSSGSQAPPVPEKPMPPVPASTRPLARAPTHRRIKSDDTMVEPVERDSTGSLDTIVEVPTPMSSPPAPVPVRVPSRTAMRTPLGAMQPGEFDRMRSMTRTPPSALSKKSSMMSAGSRLPRKESVRFAPTPTVFGGNSPVEEETPTMPVPAMPMPVRPPPAATLESTLRSPMRKPVRMTDSIVALSEAQPAPRKNLPQPTIVIPGRPERQERDTIFVMETPVQLQNRYDMPAQVVSALSSPTGSFESDHASSILDYYGASSPGGSAQVSPVNGNDFVPRVNVVPDSDEGHKQQQQQQQLVAPRARAPAPAPAGLLTVPAPGRRPSATPPRPGYL